MRPRKQTQKSRRPGRNRVRETGNGRTGARTSLAPLLAVIAVLACRDVESTPSRTRVTDSAGVQIVTNPSAGVPIWELDSAPLTQIGLVDGPPEYVFSNPTKAKSSKTGTRAPLTTAEWATADRT